MSAVFADTFFFLGLLNRADAAHTRCLQFSQTHRAELLSTEWVLVELADALCKPPLRERIGEFVGHLYRNPRVRIVPSSPELLRRGLVLYTGRRDKAWSLTDCLSFVVMQDHALTDALTGDEHFEQAGFKALLK
ncbi:MAG: type II toxin-antitoxin system VapC family toxin [Verrucomicrobia bacterium]|nr:type II toxin-antitoxin system VapC family toxin [Verrucomicrobiota bacterium]